MPEGPFGFPRATDWGPFVTSENTSADGDWVRVYFHSSENMPELEDESVSLTVTSPPYNIDWEYDDLDDEREYNEEYLPMLARVFSEVWDKTTPGGRLVVNLPTVDLTKKDKSTARSALPVTADVQDMMVGTFGDETGMNVDIRELQRDTNWFIENHIIWDKTQAGATRAHLGSLPRPFNPLLNARHESITIFRKPGNRDFTKTPDELIEESRLASSFFTSDARDNIWPIRPVAKFREGEAPSFPEEIPRRLIKFYTFKGDLVLDPFVGTGTTLKVAKELERPSVGYEVRDDLRSRIEDKVEEKV